MKCYHLFFMAVLFILFAGTALAQGTTVKLPTTDNTSSFKITDSNDNSMLQVKGDGSITGDGSSLDNVKSLINYVQGWSSFQVPNDATVSKARQVTINAPAEGKIFVNVTGFADWESVDEDIFRCCISDNSNLTMIDANYQTISTDLECPDSSDHFTPFTSQRVFSVNSAGSYTFYLYAENPTWAAGFSNSLVTLKCINMVAMYFPTGSVAVANPIPQPMIVEEESERIMMPGSLDGTPSDYSEPDNTNDAEKRIEALENELAIIKKQLNQIIDINKRE